MKQSTQTEKNNQNNSLNIETPSYGELYFADLISDDSVQGNHRPVLIISNNMGNKHSPNVSIVPLTSQFKAMHLRTHVPILTKNAVGLSCDSVALVENINTISKKRLGKKIGNVLNEHMRSISEAICVQYSIYTN